MIPEKHIDEAISKLFTDLTFTPEPAGLYDPLRYMMEIGGKKDQTTSMPHRLRPV